MNELNLKLKDLKNENLPLWEVFKSNMGEGLKEGVSGIIPDNYVVKSVHINEECIAFIRVHSILPVKNDDIIRSLNNGRKELTANNPFKNDPMIKNFSVEADLPYGIYFIIEFNKEMTLNEILKNEKVA